MKAYAPNYPEEDQCTNADAFRDALKALDLFADSTQTKEGRESVLECKRHLMVAYEYYEDDNDWMGSKMIGETREMFRKARRFITISDE
jgi:hypothetical protein